METINNFRKSTEDGSMKLFILGGLYLVSFATKLYIFNIEDIPNEQEAGDAMFTVAKGSDKLKELEDSEELENYLSTLFIEGLSDRPWAQIPTEKIDEAVEHAKGMFH